jgi:pimeloyl-ACP methyl ester carboxylesterase
VLLHSAWSDGREWRPQLAGLSDEFDVIAWDAPGCGGSDDPPPEMGMADYADAVADLITALDLRRVHLCGLSFGGGLALAVYRRYPQLVLSLVLASAYAGWKGSLPPEEVRARLARARGELDVPPAEWIDSYLSGFFARPVPPETLDLVRSIMLEVRSAGTRPMLAAFAEADLRAVLELRACAAARGRPRVQPRGARGVQRRDAAVPPNRAVSTAQPVVSRADVQKPEIRSTALQRHGVTDVRMERAGRSDAVGGLVGCVVRRRRKLAAIVLPSRLLWTSGKGRTSPAEPPWGVTSRPMHCERRRPRAVDAIGDGLSPGVRPGRAVRATTWQSSGG